MLTEIHRRPASAIIRLATMARQGLPILYGEHDAYVWKMPRSLMPAQMLRGGQVICGRNATRVQLNIAMKRAAGFDTTCRRAGTATAREKIICLKNRTTSASSTACSSSCPTCATRTRSASGDPHRGR